jgi:hypothetical protein
MGWRNVLSNLRAAIGAYRWGWVDPIVPPQSEGGHSDSSDRRGSRGHGVPGIPLWRGETAQESDG